MGKIVSRAISQQRKNGDRVRPLVLGVFLCGPILICAAAPSKESRHNKLTDLFQRRHECVVPFTVEIGSFQIE